MTQQSPKLPSQASPFFRALAGLMAVPGTIVFPIIVRYDFTTRNYREIPNLILYAMGMWIFWAIAIRGRMSFRD